MQNAVVLTGITPLKTLCMQMVIKFLERGSRSLGGQISKMTEKDVCSQAKLQHPHLIDFKGVILTERHLGVVMEHALVLSLLCVQLHILALLRNMRSSADKQVWQSQMPVLMIDGFRSFIKANSCAYDVLCMLQGGTLWDHVTRQGGLTEDEARRFFQQQLLALSFAHRRGVAMGNNLR